MLRLGWEAGPEQCPPEELLDYVVAAEEAGFEAVDASDHFHPWSEEGQAAFIWTWLGAAAARTTRIVLGLVGVRLLAPLAMQSRNLLRGTTPTRVETAVASLCGSRAGICCAT